MEAEPIIVIEESKDEPLPLAGRIEPEVPPMLNKEENSSELAQNVENEAESLPADYYLQVSDLLKFNPKLALKCLID